jgi:hypothetical protein
MFGLNISSAESQCVATILAKVVFGTLTKLQCYRDFVKLTVNTNMHLHTSLSLMKLRIIMLIVSFDRGDYGDAITVQTLKDFHRERVKILVDAGADLIAFETIPNKLDAQVTITFANLIKFHFDFEYAH